MTEDAAPAIGEPEEEADDYVAEAWPWPRFWARTFDIYLNSCVIGAMIGVIAPGLFDLPILSGNGGNYLIGISMLPFAFLLDALIQAIIGTTPGKAIAGIRVETLAHGHLSLGEALRRNLLVYLRGAVLGLPILSLIGYTKAYDRVSAFEPATWDEELGTRVFERGNGIGRTIIIAVLAVGLIIGLVALEALMKAEAPNQRVAAIEAALPILNRELPTFLDDVTRFDRVAYSAQEDVMFFDYTLIHRDATAVRPDETTDLAKAAPSLRQAYCGAEMKSYRDLNLPIRYRYRHADGIMAQEFRVGPDDCGKPAA